MSNNNRGKAIGWERDWLANQPHYCCSYMPDTLNPVCLSDLSNQTGLLINFSQLTDAPSKHTTVENSPFSVQIHVSHIIFWSNIWALSKRRQLAHFWFIFSIDLQWERFWKYSTPCYSVCHRNIAPIFLHALNLWNKLY